MDTTGIGPRQILTYTFRPETKSDEATEKREKAVQEGKLTKVVKSITGQQLATATGWHDTYINTIILSFLTDKEYFRSIVAKRASN